MNPWQKLYEVRVPHLKTRDKRYSSSNLEMSQDVYKLRRVVINYIYEARNLIGNMPRVEVRITDNVDYDTQNILGVASMDKNKFIWIPSNLLSMSKLAIKYVVFHELLHAVFKIKHDPKSYLMSPSIKRDLDSLKIDKDFISFATTRKRDLTIQG